MVRKSKLQQLVNCRIRVTLNDGRWITGKFLAYDKFLNIVMSDCEEARKFKKALKDNGGTSQSVNENNLNVRNLGMIVLRGETIVSLTPENIAPMTNSNGARVPASMQIIIENNNLASGIPSKFHPR